MGKPKKPAAHPPSSAMVKAAIKALGDKKGSSLAAIKKYVAANYKVDIVKISPFIRKALKKGVDSKALIQVKGSYKLAKEAKPKVTKVKKPKAAKKAKSPKKAKKPAAKKPKSPKKAASTPCENHSGSLALMKGVSSRKPFLVLLEVSVPANAVLQGLPGVPLYCLVEAGCCSHLCRNICNNIP